MRIFGDPLARKLGGLGLGSGANSDQSYAQRIQSILPANLLAYWSLGESSGATANDVSGNGRNAAYNGPTLAQVLMPSGVLVPSFDGSNDVVNLFSASLQSAFNGAAGTALLWFKVSALADWTDGAAHTLLYLRVDASNLVQIAKGATNNRLEWTYIAGGTTEFLTSTAFADTNVHSIGITWSKAADEVKRYVDGSQVGATATGVGTWVGSLNSNVTCAGALQAAVPNQVWHGGMGQIALWNTPLSAAQMLSLAT